MFDVYKVHVHIHSHNVNTHTNAQGHFRGVKNTRMKDKCSPHRTYRSTQPPTLWIVATAII